MHVSFSTSISSTKEEEGFSVLIEIDNYTLHVSSNSKSSLIPSVPNYPVVAR
jgi:hypothetical protein